MKDPVTHWDSLICQLCESQGYHVRSSLACYADDGRFERMDRCIDHQACRDRVEAEGDDWPLIDITERWVPA